MLNVECLVSNDAFQENTYAVIESNTRQALIIDPGAASEMLVSWLKDLKVNPIAILLTHAHIDHIQSIDFLREEYHIPLYQYYLEESWLADASLNLSAFLTDGGLTYRSAETIWDEEHLGENEIGPFQFQLAHVPGHSPGHVLFYFEEDHFVISGDVIFKEGIGRTDLAGGDTQQLFNSIRKEIYTLPHSTTIYPGHGPATTVLDEQQHNPYNAYIRKKPH